MRPLPHSWLSVFIPTSVRETARTQAPLLFTKKKLSTSLDITTSSSSTSAHNVSSNEAYGLNASHLMNGTIVSSLVTDANSIRDAIGEAITCQQCSIESKLVKIADSLNVLPDLTQKISNLEAKVHSLETLLNERTNLLVECNRFLIRKFKECEILREQLNKQTCTFDSKISDLENSITIAVKAIKSNSHCGSASHTDTDTLTENNTCIQSPPACDNSTASRATTSPSEAMEVIISSFINKDTCNIKLAAFSAIGAVLN